MKNPEIIKGYIIEPKQSQPFYSCYSVKSHRDDIIHPIKIIIKDNGHLPDYGCFMVSGIQCRLSKNHLVVPDITSNGGNWYYRPSEPIREIGQIIIVSQGKGIDATETTDILWKRYTENFKKNPSHQLNYTLTHFNYGLTPSCFYKIMGKFGTNQVLAKEFFSWLLFLNQNHIDKGFCRDILRNSSPQEFQQKFQHTTCKYIVAKKAVQYYVDKMRGDFR